MSNDEAQQLTVGNLMTRTVVTVSRETGFHDLVAQMSEHRVSGVPVIDEQRRVVGIVSEADLLRQGAHDRKRTRALDWLLHPSRTEEAHARGHDAGTIMSAPAVTVRPQTTIWEAIRTLREARVKRLPVVDEEGILVGIVSRADLLAAFDRTDEQIVDQVRSIARKVLRSDLSGLSIDVREGRVTLDGSVGFASQRDVLMEMIRHIPGVLEIDNRLEVAASEGSAGIPFAPIQPPGEELGPRVDL